MKCLNKVASWLQRLPPTTNVWALLDVLTHLHAFTYLYSPPPSPPPDNRLKTNTPSHQVSLTLNSRNKVMDLSVQLNS